jgi:hypothetical protein
MGRVRTHALIVLSLDVIESLWNSGIGQSEVLRGLGVTKRGLGRIKADLRLKSRRPPLREASTKPEREDISPEELAHRIAKVQATWTDEVFVLRAMGRARPLPYRIKVVSVGSLS